MPPYAELHAHSNFSFLEGASHVDELVLRALELGYETLALTDHDGLHGAMEFAQCARAWGLRPITGAEITLAGGKDQGASSKEDSEDHLTLLCETPRGYANLCRLLTHAHLDHERGKPRVKLDVVATGNVHYHRRERHRLQDALVAIKNRTTLDASHQLRRENSEYFLKPPAEMAQLFNDHPQAIAKTQRIAERCRFDLTRDL